MDPKNPDVLYAALYQRRRVPWGFSGGGPGGGIYKTMNGGDAWKKIEKGIPAGPLGRIGLSLFHGDPRIVYAIVEHKNGERRLPFGRSRRELHESLEPESAADVLQPHLRRSATTPNGSTFSGAEFFTSDDGGTKFVENEEMTPTYDVGVHGDHHSLWIDPRNSEHLLLGGDGGLYVSWDRGRHWDKVNNIPLAQFYSVAVDHGGAVQHLRGDAGQSLLVRAERDAELHRNPERGLAADQFRRWDVPAGGSQRSGDHLHVFPGGKHRAPRSHARAIESRSGRTRAPRKTTTDSIGRRPFWSPVIARAFFTSGETGSSPRPTGVTPGSRART